MIPAPPGVPPAPAYGALVTSQKENESGVEAANIVPGSKTVSGTTATISATMPRAANLPFNCAEVVAQNFSEGGEPDVIFFPLTTKPEPPPSPGPRSAPRRRHPARPAGARRRASFLIGKAKNR